MQRTKVDSSSIKSVGYDPSSQTLEVEFKPDKFGKSKVWRYSGVSQETAGSMLGAKSVGSYFHANVRGKFDGSEVTQ